MLEIRVFEKKYHIDILIDDNILDVDVNNFVHDNRNIFGRKIFGYTSIHGILKHRWCMFSIYEADIILKRWLLYFNFGRN